MHGLKHNKGITSYTDIDGDGLHISAIDDNNGHPVVALEADTKGNLVHVDVNHVEDVVAALRQKAAEARTRFGGTTVENFSPVLTSLTHMLEEAGHGDNAARYAAELLADHRAELAAQAK
ncbi:MULTISPECIES: hypothetical protein [Streptomyces]|uniref:Uncharacterized protein n=1 Tax=Streptomyces rubiginosohelvolus TaxID=67362 RepID=A0ABQ3CBI1_9ACTN|nr:hypothetical protein [Streptomyces pluricolorescens]GGZ83565.1 hypothetical protein GCM10010328_67270 [Streptomyces pluricolorescens]